MEIFTIVLVAGAVIFGFFGGYVVRRKIGTKKAESAEAKAEEIVHNAKAKEKELYIKAKEKALTIIEEAQQEELTTKQELQEKSRRLEKREEIFDQRLLDLENTKSNLEKRTAEIQKLKEHVQKVVDEQFQKLEKISGLSRDEAKGVLMRNTEERIKNELAARMRKLEQESTSAVEEKAKIILSTAMQRIASQHCQETTTTVVHIANDDLKGRIIGKEGRNIKALEQLTGTEIIVDETPQTIWVSGFNPIRRHVAKRALDYLILDGRIHPTRIEEAVERAKKDIAQDIRNAGEDAAYQVGVVGLDPKLVQILGRLKYRTSYGHNVLQHSIEVALLSKTIGEELKADIPTLVKGGLLHDIGKAVDHEVKGSHPELGYQIMKKFGLPENVARMAITHHEDNPDTLEGIINKAADAISGSRYGARKDTFENYVQRLEELENVASGFDGVEKSYAIQAGREVRVFVQPQKIDDLGSVKLARDIADKIETELRYPGEIKVNVIREVRVEEYAR